MRSDFLAFAIPALLAAQPAATPGPEEIARKQLEYTRAHYTKFDYRIPMRDSVKLFTSVYVPKDTGQEYPILIQRTPYSVAPYGIDNYRATLGPSDLFSKEGFIFVYQDVRGRYLSEGTFVDVPVHKTHFTGPKDSDESTDTWDTIDWLVKNVPNNNGRAGIWGISYPGFYAAYSLIGSHPALKAASPQAPMGDVGNGGRCLSQRGLLSGRKLRVLHRFQTARPRTGAPRPQCPFRLRRLGPIRLLPPHGSPRQCQ